MVKPADLARLNRHVLFSEVASLAVLIVGVIGLLLYFQPRLTGVDSTHGSVVWLLMGGVLSAAGIVFLIILTRWPGQLKNTVLHTTPRPMLVKIEVDESSESTAFYAVLSEKGNALVKKPAWRAHIWVHPPDAGRENGQWMEGKVYFYPGTGRPAAIEYAKGVLWVMAGSGAVERLSN